MTREEAFQTVLAAGIPKEDITEADLIAVGFEAKDVTIAPVPPAVSDEQIAADIAAANVEAQANTTAAQVLQGVKTAAGIAGTLAGVAVKAP